MPQSVWKVNDLEYFEAPAASALVYHDFYPDGRGANCMRLAFCYEQPEEIAEGVRRIAEVLEDKLELYRAFVAAGAVPASAVAV